MWGTAAYLDGVGFEFEAIVLLLTSQKLLKVLSLVTLELNHVAHFGIFDNVAIASYPKLVTPSKQTN